MLIAIEKKNERKSDSRLVKVIILCRNDGPDLRGLGDGVRSGPRSLWGSRAAPIFAFRSFAHK